MNIFLNLTVDSLRILAVNTISLILLVIGLIGMLLSKKHRKRFLILVIGAIVIFVGGNLYIVIFGANMLLPTNIPTFQ